MNNLSNLVVYNDGELELKVSVDSETVWLNRNQLSELFGRDVKTIGKHINNVFNEKELVKNMVVANFATSVFTLFRNRDFYSHMAKFHFVSSQHLLCKVSL